MARWTIESLPWEKFDPSKIDPDLLAYAKAACLVEANAADYVTYLCNVFQGNANLCQDIRVWGNEECQHGQALRKWAETADPTFDYENAMRIFKEGFHFEWNQSESIRGSQALELISRCVVETGTSSFYTALRDRAEEPVFREICRLIAGDEVRHYNLFISHFDKQYAGNVSRWERLKIILQRSSEVTDEELCFAYAAANFGKIERERLPEYAAHYIRFIGSVFKARHMQTAVQMMSRAAGLPLKRPVSKSLGALVHVLARVRMGFGKPSLHS